MKDIVFDLIKAEERRQQEGLELVPSENYVSAAVLRAMGSVLTNKYSEGYPNLQGLGYDQSAAEFAEKDLVMDTEIAQNYRYYGGQQNVDKIERLAIARACRLFKADHANVQPHSGANANEAVYFVWCRPGDKILAMSLPAGGHLTHGAAVTRSAKFYNFIHYGVTTEGDIDYEELEAKALAEKPRIILVGYSAFMKVPDFQRVAEIAKRVEAAASETTGEDFEVLLMADMAHVAGLIAGAVHPNPLEYGFQVMTSTTHKTLRGPRGGLILSRGKVGSPLKKVPRKLAYLPILIDRAVFPGTQGGPLEHVIAAKAVALGEAEQPSFRGYVQQVLTNARVLAVTLQERGFVLQGGGTDNHLIVIDCQRSFGVDGKLYERALDLVGLTLNANALPRDRQGAFKPSGVRLGTPAITTRGLGEEEMQSLAKWMKMVADICQQAQDEEGLSAFQGALQLIATEVRELALRFPLPSK